MYLIQKKYKTANLYHTIALRARLDDAKAHAAKLKGKIRIFKLKVDE